MPLGAVAAAGLWLDVEVPRLTRDPAVVAEVGPLTGSLSNLGVMLWCASAAIWLFSATLLRARGARADARFALVTGLLTTYLALDDLFLIHEELAPTHLGMREGVYVALLVALGLTYVLVFRRRIFQRRAVVLLAALALLATSMLIDALLEPRYWPNGTWTYLVEDGLKWIGIVCWLAFCVAWCRGELLTPPRVKPSLARLELPESLEPSARR